VGTPLETIVVMYLFGSLWHRWTLPFRVVTPMLHLLFSAAQPWGAWIFFGMAKNQSRKAVERRMKLRRRISIA